MRKYLFGPVPSRRLGMSLGVDLVPHKTCTLDCVYCECGATTDLTTERKEYVPTRDVIEELKEFFAEKPELNYVTFSGAGEPTLHSGIGEIVAFIKKNTPFKLCLLTNATLLDRDNLMEELKDIDLIVPSLDAVSDEDFKKVNRPAEELRFQHVEDNIATFRRESQAEMWLEIFVVPGGNDSPESLERFRSAVEKIKPDKVQLNTLDRPGCVDWIRPPTEEEVDVFAQALAGPVPIEVVGRFRKNVEVRASYGKSHSLEVKVLELISRRPCTIEDMAVSSGFDESEIAKMVEKLFDEGKISSETRERGVFYRKIIE